MADPITIEAAQRMGETGGEPSEAERLLFEAWMRGHCWKVGGRWNGTTYVHADESGSFVDGDTMFTRCLWAAWRDRAALARAADAPPPPPVAQQGEADGTLHSDGFFTWNPKKHRYGHRPKSLNLPASFWLAAQQTAVPLTAIPTSIIEAIGEYGAASRNSRSEPEIMRRWGNLIDAIRREFGITAKESGDV